MSAEDELRRRLRGQVNGLNPDAPTIDNLQATSAGRRSRRIGMGVFAALVLAGGALAGSAVLSGNQIEDDRVQAGSPVEDATSSQESSESGSASSGSGSSTGFGAVDLDLGDPPINWTEVLLPAGVGWVDRIVDTGDGVLLVSQDGIWASPDLANWNQINMPAGVPQSNGYLRSLSARGDSQVPDRSVIVEVDDLTVTLTTGPGGEGFLVTDGDGALVSERLVDFSTGSPEGIQYGSRGSLRLLGDDGSVVVEIPSDVMEAAYQSAYEREEREDPDLCGDGGVDRSTLHVSRDGGLTWTSSAVSPGLEATSPRVQIHRQIELHTDGSAAVGVLMEFANVNIECAAQLAGIDAFSSGDGYGASYGEDIDGVTIESGPGQSTTYSWDELGLSDDEVEIL